MKTVSFYSYKGGAGRTLATVNFAAVCAQEIKNSSENSKPILLLDLDIDSAGLTMLLESFGANFEREWTINQILTGQKNVSGNRKQFNQLMQEGFIDVSGTFGLEENSIHFLPAEKLGQEKTVINDEHSMGQLKNGILRKPSFKNKYAAVLLDAASGRQQTALLAHALSDLVIYFFRITRQFQEGTKNNISYYQKKCEDRRRTKTPDFLLLPSAVPERVEDWQKKRYSHLIGVYKAFVAKMKKQGIKCYFKEEGLPEVEQFKWYEEILFKQDSADYTKSEKKMVEIFEQMSHEYLIGK